MFCEKLTNTIYRFRPANPVNKLNDKRDKFEGLVIEKQCEVLNELLHLTQCKPLTANLLELGESKDSGKMQKSTIVSNAKSAVLVHPSITGLYEQVVDLQTV